MNAAPKGIVYLVGAGPGDPGLLTLRGRDLLARAEVVVYDYLAAERLLDFVPPSAERVYVGKQAGEHTLRQEDINELLVDRARRGKRVVRLKGGDPFVFGRGGEEALALVEQGLPFEVVPGVTAGIAAPAYAGIPVTHREMASSFGVVTGHETPDKESASLNWKALASWGGTLAFYMGMANLDSICSRLTEGGLSADTPAAVIRWGTTARQQVVVGTLANLGERVRLAGLRPPAIVVVGAVVALREKLIWFERRPLFGRRIVVTRARAHASELTAALEELGAEVIELSAIRIEPVEDAEPLRRAVAEIGSYQWLVFTSVNGVEALFASLRECGRDARALGGVRVAAIGPATAERLAAFGIRADVTPERFISTAVVDVLAGADDLRGKRILCPRADIAPKELIEELSHRGASVTNVVAYRTVADNSGAAEVARRLAAGEVDWITFTSSSTVENFVKAVGGAAVRESSARIASIGPSTSQTARRLGLIVSAEAREFTIQGLVTVVVNEDAKGERAATEGQRGIRP